MPLILLNYPSLGTTVGSVVSITNAKTGSGQGMAWTYQNQGGAVQGVRSYTNTMRVITTSPFVGPIQVQQALIGIGCVQGTTYRFPLQELNGDGLAPAEPTETDTGSFLHSISIKQETEDAQQWLATFEYGPGDVVHELGTSNAASGSANPLEKAPEVQWSAANYEVELWEDVNGQAALNTAGDPIEGALKGQEVYQTLSFVRNEAQFVQAWAQAYRNCTNSDVFLGFQPNQAKVKSIEGKRIYTGDYGYFWEVSYQFEFRQRTVVDPNTDDGEPTVYGWEERVASTGFRQLVSGVKTQILVSNQPVSNPALLDENGVAVAVGGQPYFLTFQMNSQLPFAFLNIPTDVLTAAQ